MFTDQTARATSRNLAATHRAGMRTGLREAPAPGAVTIWCGPGPTKLPHNLPQPVQHPEPSNVDPAQAKVAAARERCAQRQLANQRRRNQRAAQKAARLAANPPAVHHFFGSTALNWATGATREEVIAKLARVAGADLIKRQVKAHGGLYCWTCRVDVAQSTNYSINNYAPEGVPTAAAQECNLLNTKGKTATIVRRK
jgi:hypothetical protein